MVNIFTINLIYILSFVATSGINSFFTIKIEEDKRQAFTINGRAQGTTYSILYYADSLVVNKKQVENIFDEIDQSLSVYKENTLINQFNESVHGVQMDVHMKNVVKKSIEVAKQSKGVFDITLNPLIQLWGFGTKKVSSFPASASVKASMKCVGYKKIKIKGNRLIKKKPCVQINVNAIAPGYTSDLIAAFLKKNGIRTYLVEVGGELRIEGVKPNGEYMNVGIESPPTKNDGQEHAILQRILTVPMGALTTAGNYRQYKETGSYKVSHLLDGRTGYPIQNELISVTVYAENAMTADAYDNVLMGLGLRESFRFLKKNKNIEAYFIYKNDNGEVVDTATTGFYKLFKEE